MKKPVILISTSNVNSSSLETVTGDTDILYSDKATAIAIIKAGGLPIYMPSSEYSSENDVTHYTQMADGICLTGADTNTNPLYYGEVPSSIKGRIDDERDRTDMQLVKLAQEKKIPLLGICKGMQIINVALGGALYQDILSDCSGAFNHDIKKTSRANFTHQARFIGDSKLKKMFDNTDVIRLNGGHQQGVKKLAKYLKAVAVADDGIVEAFEGKTKTFLMGIQFHAELRLFDSPYERIFQEFVASCRK